MKILAQILLLTSMITTAACSKTDDNVAVNDPASTLKQEIISNAWMVSYYTDKGKNETSVYAGYTFTFSENGTLTASVGGTSFTGTWSIADDHSGFDDSGHHSGNESKLILMISGNYQMNELSDDFQIVSISDTEIILKDDNQTKIKELRFTKI